MGSRGEPPLGFAAFVNESFLERAGISTLLVPNTLALFKRSSADAHLNFLANGKKVGGSRNSFLATLKERINFHSGFTFKNNFSFGAFNAIL
jgi:hypothetical protein